MCVGYVQLSKLVLMTILNNVETVNNLTPRCRDLWRIELYSTAERREILSLVPHAFAKAVSAGISRSFQGTRRYFAAEINGANGMCVG